MKIERRPIRVKLIARGASGIACADEHTLWVTSEPPTIHHGGPNLDEYFPEGSYVAIDIDDPEAAAATSRELISDPSQYERRLEPLREVKRLVLHEYNLMAMPERFITGHFNPHRKASGRPLYGRKRMRGRHPGDLLGHAMWEIRKRRSAPKSP